MNSRFFPLLKNDLRLGLRYGFYTIYAVLTALYIIIVRMLPESIQIKGLQLLIFTDPVVLGFYFVGGSVLLEKIERVHETLFTSPAEPINYMVSKALSFSVLSVLVSFIITLGGVGTGFNPFMLLAGVGLTSFCFTLMGLAIVSRMENVAEYLVCSMGYMLPIFVPLINFFDLAEGWWLYLFPTQATLLLLRGSFSSISIFDMVYSIIYLCIFAVICGIWARRWFEKYIIQKTGAAK